LTIGDYDGRIAIHLASSEGHLECVRFLVEQSNSLNLKDRWGNTALDDAVRHQHPEIEAYLRSAAGAACAGDASLPGMIPE